VKIVSTEPESRVQKIHRYFQKLLIQWLVKSYVNDPQIGYKDLANLLDLTLKKNLIDRRILFSKLLGDKTAINTKPEDIDLIINFSAYLRDEWFANKASSIFSGAMVLDAGAGQGRYKPLLSHARYHAQDFAQYEGESKGPLQESWDYAPLDYVCDITKIPVDSATFDVVICTEVIEHVPDPISALKELSRVTKIGGRLLLTAPLGSGVHQDPYHFYGGFSPSFYRKYLVEFGYEIEELKPVGGLMKHVAQEIYRAASIIEERGNTMNDEARYVLKDWLPRLLSEFDDRYFIEQFTVGYMVSARKIKNPTDQS
jgi:SAM-dependent methyltransferase